MQKITILLSLNLLITALTAQTSDTLKKIDLKTVEIKSYRTVNGLGRLNDFDTQEGVIYAGKKTEVIIIDSINANKAVNDTRQILGRIPGLNITESESGGFIANGVGVRGLNPNQSIEMNVRQNGYNITGDVYGYNETYYAPPMEAVHSIEVIRGAASLQYGAQFGGVINYITKTIPTDKTFYTEISQTLGSYGLFNTYVASGFRRNEWSVFGCAQYRILDGWRENSNQKQFSGFANITYQPNTKFKISFEFSSLRNNIHMPGGLTDSMFNENAQQSNRARNWVESPWNILSVKSQYAISEKTSLNFSASYLNGARNLVWFKTNDASNVDIIDPSIKLQAPREVEIENMESFNSELRLLHQYALGSNKNTLAGGVRFARANFERFEEGEGNSNADFSLEQKGYGKQQYYRTTNIAPFIENIFYFGEKFSVTPGLRFEYLSSTAKGYSHDDTSNTVFDVNAAQTRTFLLAGLGAQYKFTRFTNAYANFSQAYRPIDYAELTPIGTIAHVDPNLKDADGYNVDLGYRGTVSNFLNFDVSLFFLNYNNRIGLTTLKDAQGNEYLYRTNISRSIHKGLESYIECNFTKWIDPTVLKGGVSIFNSLTYTNAKFTDGAYANNFVEYAPEWIHRVGITYANARGFSATAQLSEQSKSFSDANNTAFDAGGIVGILPSYKVLDVSASYNLKTCTVRGGVNNFTNEKYFTHRTPEYPGPGIISAVGRNFYLGMTFRL